jgi:DNA polymerase-3 subunit gamma/tau
MLTDRPRYFSEVYGQDHVVEVLKKIAGARELPIRALFLKGPYGTGKTTLARLFAKALNCHHFKEDTQDVAFKDVCGECETCTDIDLESSMLYIEKDASIAGNIESMQALLTLLKTTSPPGGYRRTVVLDEIQAASKQSLNILLKDLEDGFRDTIIVFCSTEDLPAPLASRCLTLRFGLIPDEVISWRIRDVAKEKGIAISPYHTTLLAGMARGHLRSALMLLETYSYGGIKAVRSPYPLLAQLIVNKSKQVNNDETIQALLTFEPYEVTNSFKSFIANCYKEQGLIETALYKNKLADRLFDFVYYPQNVYAAKTREGLDAFLRKLDKL